MCERERLERLRTSERVSSSPCGSWYSQTDLVSGVPLAIADVSASNTPDTIPIPIRLLVAFFECMTATLLVSALAPSSVYVMKPSPIL